MLWNWERLESRSSLYETHGSRSERDGDMKIVFFFCLRVNVIKIHQKLKDKKRQQQQDNKHTNKEN